MFEFFLVQQFYFSGIVSEVNAKQNRVAGKVPCSPMALQCEAFSCNACRDRDGRSVLDSQMTSVSSVKSIAAQFPPIRTLTNWLSCR
jgi:hypothetical protein